MRSYKPEELFDASGRLIPELTELAPKGSRRMNANPHANGGLLLRDLRLPDFRDYAVDVPAPGGTISEPARVLGGCLRHVLKDNPDNSQLLRPDQTASHRPTATYVATRTQVARVYRPPGTNTLLSVADHCLRSRHYVNVIVAGKQPYPTWLSMDEAIIHCTRGAGIWEWASNDAPGVPDVVMACCGDVPTLEALAAVTLIREHLPELKVRLVNVVDLMRLESATEHPHGMSDAELDALFTTDQPVIFAYHGYPSLIHRLTYRRHGHDNFHVRGYMEEGTTTTPFDMVMLNNLDRYHLVMDVIDRVPGLSSSAGHVRQLMVDKRIEARAYTREQGEDLPEVANWTWPS